MCVIGTETCSFGLEWNGMPAPNAAARAAAGIGFRGRAPNGWKTTLLNHVLNNSEGRRVAVIVNDMSEVNIDADLVREGGAELSRTVEKLFEMTNGCICRTLRDDLLREVSRLATEGRFDYLLIESTGFFEPLPVAQTFSFADEEGRSLVDQVEFANILLVNKLEPAQ